MAWDSRGKEKCQTKQKHPNFRSENQGTRVRINTPFKAVCRPIRLERARFTVRHYSLGPH